MLEKGTCHRLFKETVHGKIKDSLAIDHIDSDTTINYLSNLITQSDNNARGENGM
jgi:hypothetical protein